jgi:acetolactate synthase I/II/III large subunit
MSRLLRLSRTSLPGYDPAESQEPGQDDLAAKVREVIARLNQSERPFLFAGNGVRVSGAAAVFESLFGY